MTDAMYRRVQIIGGALWLLTPLGLPCNNGEPTCLYGELGIPQLVHSTLLYWE